MTGIRFARTAFYLAIAAGLGLGLQPARAQFGTSVAPPPSYYAVRNLYDAGDYRDALSGFKAEWRGAIKNGATRWIDSICFYTMAGECYYQMGDMADALNEYNNALNLFAVHADWMLSVQFPNVVTPMAAGKVRNCPWGKSRRNVRFGDFPDTASTRQGRINNNAIIQKGGVVQQAVNFPVGYREVLRCTTIALRRRRELMGVVAKYDTASNSLVGSFTGSTGKPISNPTHWTVVWGHLQAGLAFAAAGNDAQAFKLLEQSLFAQGQYLHPLSGTAFLEMGRIEMSNARFDQALDLFAEASYVAFQYADWSLLEETFRYGQMAHLLANKPGIYPPLNAAMAWARRDQGLRFLYTSLCLLSCENAAVRGDTRTAERLLSEARGRIGRQDMLKARIGARFNYLTAMLQYRAGRVGAGDDALAAAMAFEKGGSLWLWHMRLTDDWYVQGRFSPRVAREVYHAVLREPTSADWLSDPLESLAALNTPHSGIIEHWFDAAWEHREKEPQVLLEVADLARRHRFFSTLALGGRLLSLRWVLEGPEEMLTPEQILQKQDILGQFQKFADLSKEAKKIRAELGNPLIPVVDGKEQHNRDEALKALTAIYAAQEVMLREIALRRQPCDLTFPPKRKVEDLKAALAGPEQGVLAFFNTNRRVYGFLLTTEGLETWEIGTPAAVNDLVTRLLRAMGHIDGNRPVTAGQLEDDAWQKVAHQLFTALLKGARTNFPKGFDELCVVPDGALWYVPFEIMNVSPDPATYKPLLTQARVRYAPTAGLSLATKRVSPKIASSLITYGKMYPNEAETVGQNACQQLAKILPGANVVDKKPLVAPPALLTSFYNQLVVLDDVDAASSTVYDISPLPLAAGTAGADVGSWMSLPWEAPDLVVMPGFHSGAENSMKRTKAELAGADLFLPIMGLMASGSKTCLIGRWRTAGKTCYDLVDEFAAETPHTTPADAWQRSVMLAMETPIQPSHEPRIQLPGIAAPPLASHPFFWSGYMLVDSGVAPTAADNPNAVPLLDPKLEEKRKLLEQKKAEEEAKKKVP